MIAPLTERQKDLIVANVIDATRNIDALNGTGYKYLSNAAGFIAHYDLQGFIAYYSDHQIKHDILSYAGSNKFNNFQPGDENYEYYKSRADVYARIVKAI